LADEGYDIPLKGGVRFTLGPLGEISPANLTPDIRTGIGRYSDGQIFRMMRHAVKPDDSAAMALMMPFWNMAYEDLIAVVSYLRSLEPIENEVPKPKLYDFYGHVLGQMFAITLAVFIGASAVVSLRTSLFPAWVGWFSVLIAFGLLTPIGYLVLILAFVWLLWVSLWLYRRGVAVVDV
jgi:hypothetical protein